MARPLRLEYEGALYHVTSRGNERGVIFRDDRDRGRFLEILGLIGAGCRWVIHSYCLMGNHYHLVVETLAANLALGMQRINGRYTQWFNFRHDRSGHLFQGRYKAILVEREEHLLELCRYVVLNPVRARMVEEVGQWPWSNYRMTSGRISPPKWLEVDWTLAQFSSRRQAAQESYRRFVAEGKRARSPLKELWGQAYLGGEVFRLEMDARLKGQDVGSEIPEAQRRPWVAEIDAIKAVVAREFDRRPEELSRRRGGEDKMAAIYLCRELTILTGVQIGKAFGVSGSQVSHIVGKVRATAERGLRKRLDRLRREIARHA